MIDVKIKGSRKDDGPTRDAQIKTHSEQEVAYKPIIYKRNVSAKIPK